MIRLLLVAAIANGLSIQPGHEYMYEYETQIATGVPTECKMYSGMKLKSTVRFQTLTATSMIMKMETPALYQLNDLVETADPTNQQLPDDMFRQLQGEEVSLMQRELTKPVKFTYIRGTMKNIQTEADDPHWSVNIKRGLLSLAIMNLEERRSMDAVSRFIHLNRIPQNQAEVYRVMERSIGGECETVYKVQPISEANGEPKLHVTKTRNYMKCLNRASFTHTMFHGLACAECEKDRTEPVKSGSQIHYVLRGNKRQFVIESTIAESQHVFTPYSEAGGNVATYVNQTFLLMSIKPEQHRIPDLRNPMTQPSGLLAEIPEQKQQPLNRPPVTPESQSSQEQPQSPPQHQQQMQEMTMQKIDKLLHSIATFTDVNVQEEAGPMVMALLEESQKADTHVMWQLFQKYGSEKNPQDRRVKHIRKVLLDIIPFVGTHASVETLVEAIRADKVTHEEVSCFLNILVFAAKPDIRTAQKLMEIADNAFVNRHKYVKQSVWLNLGAMGYRLMDHHKKMKSSLQQKVKIVNQILQQENRSPVRRELESKKRQLQDKLEQSSTLASQIRHGIVQKVQELLRSERMEDKILALKTIGNAGFEEWLPEVVAILEDKSHPLIYRSQAVWNLRKMIESSPKAVRDILLPRFFDRREDEEVRIASYVMITLTIPPRPVLQMIAQSLRWERNPHVGTFVYTHLEQIKSSSNPCHMSMAKMATYVLRFAKKWKPRYHYSRFQRFSSYNDKLKMGGAVEYGLISSPREMFPRSGSVRSEMQAFGYSMNAVEVGYNAEGLQKLLSKLVGPDGHFARGKPFADVIKQSGQRSSGTQQQQEQQQSPSIQQQLGVTPRQSPQTNGHIYFKLFGNEFRYFNLDNDFVMELLRSGKLSVSYTEEELRMGRPLNIYKTIVFANTENVIVTEAGLPIRLKLRSSGVFKVDGSMTFSGVPALFKANRPGQNARGITARVNMKPSTVFNMRGTMEIDGRFFKSGAAVNAFIHAEAPMTWTMNADPIQGTISTKLDVSQLREKVMKMEITPQTYVQIEPNDIRKWPAQPDTKDIDVMKGAKLNTFSMDFGTKTAGLTFSIKGQSVNRNFNPNVPYFPFYGKQQMYVTVSPGTTPPSVMEIQLKCLGRGQEQPQRTPQHSGESSSEQSSSWLSGLMTGFFGGGQRSQQQQTQSQQRQRQQQQGSAEQSQLPQRSIDISMSSLLQKVQGVSPVYQDGSKYGFVVLFTTLSPNTQPSRQVKVYALYQRMPNGQRQRITLRILRTPIAPVDLRPWKVDIDAELQFPRSLVDPSQLLDPSYQQEIQRQIQILVRQDGQQQLKISLGDLFSSQQAKFVHKIQSSSNVKEIIEELVNNIIEKCRKSSDSELQELAKVATIQMKSCQRAKSLRQQSYDSQKSSKKLQTLMELIEKSQLLQSMIKQKIQSVSRRNHDTKKALILKYAIMKHQEMHHNLKQVSKALQSSIPASKQQELGQMLSQQKAILQDMKVKQSTLLNSRSDSELRQQGSSQSSRVRCLEAVEQMMHAQAQAMRQLSSPPQSRSSEQVQQGLVQHVIEYSKAAQEQCKRHFSEPTSDNSEVQEKLTEALIQDQQIVQSLKQQILEKIQEWQQQNQRPQQESEQQQQLSITQKEQLKEQAKKISKILAQVETTRMEKENILQSIPSGQQPTYKKLQKIEIMQVVAANHLKAPAEDITKSQGRKRAEKQRLKDSLETAESAQQQISRIVDSTGIDWRSPQFVAKVAQVVEKQAKLMNSVLKRAKTLRVEYISQKQQKDPELEQAKEKAENLLLLHLPVMEKVRREQEKQQQVQRTPRAESSQLSISKKTMKILKQIRREQMQQEQKLDSLQRSSLATFLQEKLQAEVEVNKRLTREIESAQKQLQYTKPSLISQPVVETMQRALKTQKQILERLQQLTNSWQHSFQNPDSLKMQIRTQRQKLLQMETTLQQLVTKVANARPSSQEQSSREQQSQNYDRPGESQQSIQRRTGPFQMSMTITYGENGQEMQEIRIQLVGKKSIQQLISEQQQTSPIQRSELTKQYLKDKEQGDETVKKSYRLLQKELNSYRHFHMDITYNKDHLPQYVQTFFWKCQEMMKVMWYPHISMELPNPQVPDGHIQMMFNVHNNDEQMDMYLMTPYETDRFMSLMLPTACKEYFTNIQSSMRSYSWHKRQPPRSVIPQQPEGICQMKGMTVQTLDQKEYKVPSLQGCDAVLVMDCSSASKFAVKIQPKSDPQKKVIKVRAGMKTVEVDQTIQPTWIKIDGRVESLHDGQSKRIPQPQAPTTQSQSESQRPEMVISKEGKIVTMRMPKHGVEVKSDGEQISVKVSPYHYSKVCGLCGNYDGKKDNDYEGPQREIHISPMSFVYKYLQPNQQCTAEKIRQLQTNSQPHQQSSHECTPLKRTVIRHDQQGKICFSIQPVNQCKQGCRATRSQSKPIKLHCMDNTPRAQELQRQSSQRPLTEMQGMRVDKTDHVSEPVSCANA